MSGLVLLGLYRPTLSLNFDFNLAFIENDTCLKNKTSDLEVLRTLQIWAFRLCLFINCKQKIVRKMVNV